MNPEGVLTTPACCSAPVRWSLAIPIALLAPLGMWWVLKRLLLIQLPSGIFEIG